MDDGEISRFYHVVTAAADVCGFKARTAHSAVVGGPCCAAIDVGVGGGGGGGG